MWNKIYLIALAVLFLPMVFLTFYSWSWLQSIDAPQTVIENYNYYSNISWTFLWLSTAILLILANVLLWKTRKAWALWTTFLYFAFFILIRDFWLDVKFTEYWNTHFASQSRLSVTAFIAVILCVIAATIAFFDQFLVNRLRDKMHGEPTLIKNQAEPLLTEEKESTELIETPIGEERHTPDIKTN
jgi:hypothetical protein